ncbi:MAG TPA: hypothetical protein VGE74_29665 [Gemmata sp.]
MAPAVYTVGVETPARSVAEPLLERGVRHLFVADPSGVVISPIGVLKTLG